MKRKTEDAVEEKPDSKAAREREAFDLARRHGYKISRRPGLWWSLFPTSAGRFVALTGTPKIEDLHDATMAAARREAGEEGA